MSDIGTMATTPQAEIGPETTQETDEMRTVRGVFDRALNAIVAATNLAKQVEDLAAKVAGLQRDIDSVMEANRRLDEALTAVRAQRDEARSEAASLRSQLAEAQSDRQRVTNHRDSLNDDLNCERNAHQVTHNYMRDETQRADRAEAELGRLREQMATLHAAFRSAFPTPNESSTTQSPTWPTA